MTLIEQLKAAGFRLGGSRRMAEKYPSQVQVSPETDWDFYGEVNCFNRSVLNGMGFKLLDTPNRNYWDDLLVDMYKHPNEPVEVLLRSDVALYSRAFESIPASTFVNSLWKSSPIFCGKVMDAPQFKAEVCDYFNSLFKRTAEVTL